MFLNRIDEKNRFSGLEIHLCPISQQSDTHELSYLGARNMYQKLNITMGFDKLDFKYEVNITK